MKADEIELAMNKAIDALAPRDNLERLNCKSAFIKGAELGALVQHQNTVASIYTRLDEDDAQIVGTDGSV